MKSEYAPSAEDARILAEAIMEDYKDYYDGGNTIGGWGYNCRYCCSNYVSNYTDEITHEPDCPVLVAKDVLTGIGNV